MNETPEKPSPSNPSPVRMLAYANPRRHALEPPLLNRPATASAYCGLSLRVMLCFAWFSGPILFHNRMGALVGIGMTIVWLTIALAAIILGIVGLRRAKTANAGRSDAILGLIIGSAALGIAAFLFYQFR